MKSNLSRIPRLYSAEAVLAEAALDKEQQDRQARKNNTWVEFSSSKPHVVFYEEGCTHLRCYTGQCVGCL